MRTIISSFIVFYLFFIETVLSYGLEGLKAELEKLKADAEYLKFLEPSFFKDDESHDKNLTFEQMVTKKG